MAEIGGIPRLTVERLAPHAKPVQTIKKAEPSSPIGIFDSGVGGLTVLAEVMRQLPNEDVIYLADTARVPFGGRPYKEIMEINYEILNFFARQGVKLVIMACGTSSALAYPVVKDQYKFPIISIIEPGVRAALSVTRNKRIGIIATQNTVESGAFQDRLLKTVNNLEEVVAEACPLFVPLIEGGFMEAQETKAVAEEYLKPMKRQKVDTLILGCTHYPHLSKVINGIINAKLINPAVEVARETRKVLANAHLLKTAVSSAKYDYYTTAAPQQFEVLGTRLMGKAIGGAKLVKL